jgi:hypothetical protein
MGIRFSCDCGKSYEVDDSHAGKLMRCNACQQNVRIPSSTPNSSPLSESLPPSDDSSLTSVSEEIRDLMASIVPKPLTRNPIPYSPEAQSLQAIHHRKESDQGFAAANPGLLRVDLLKYFQNFPYPLMLRSGLLLVALAISLLSWLGIPLIVFSGYLIYLHVQWVKEKFISGCICPGKILSVSPPVVAVFADLSIGEGTCKVIRLMEQPLHRLDPSRARPGRVSAICNFLGMYPGLSDHWFMPLPTIPELVSGNEKELQRIFESIPDPLWQQLDAGLRQLPPKPELRTYRIIPLGFRPRLKFSSAMELSAICRNFLPQVDGKIEAEVTSEILAKATKFLKPPPDPASVVAVVESLGAGAIIKLGGVTFFFRDESKKPISIPWTSIKVAYTSMEYMEIITTANERILVPCKAAMRTMVQLEKLINHAVGVGPND